jgi:putative ABC transport system permease protein
MIWENLKMAGRSIAGNKLRTLLTMLGVIIGVGAVVAINSIGQGLQNQVGSQVTSLGSNIIFILPGQVTGGSGKGGFNPAASVGTSTLTTADIDTVKHTQGVDNITYLSLISGIVSHDHTQDGSALLIATSYPEPKNR